MYKFPSPNYTQVANIIFDVFMAIASNAEFKCLMAIVRHTIGWHRQSAEISYKEMIKLTGLSKQGIIDSVESLEQYGWIYVVRRDNNQKNIYAINLEKQEIVDSIDGGSQLSLPPLVNSVDPRPQSLKKELNKDIYVNINERRCTEKKEIRTTITSCDFESFESDSKNDLKDNPSLASSSNFAFEKEGKQVSDVNQSLASSSLKDTRQGSYQSINQTHLKKNSSKARSKSKKKKDNINKNESSSNSNRTSPTVEKDYKNDKSYNKEEIGDSRGFKTVSYDDKTIAKKYLGKDERKQKIFDVICNHIEKDNINIPFKEISYWVNNFDYKIIKIALDHYHYLIVSNNKDSISNHGGYIRSIINKFSGKENPRNPLSKEEKFAINILMQCFDIRDELIPFTVESMGVVFWNEDKKTKDVYYFNSEYFREELISRLN